ncbi:polysaccharide biosynthesis tyrosine autokinase [Aquiflexum sp. TKW24L]|uniref:tyrosine-protein kinase family protein n=1 Tax=Aquiflexum sp. TKW24L TaxID=2942212 RepID=UPI0020BECB00|nr:tyrosine-protein kinase family protein [Aquiflexum sp. TKW24L]MCL6260778.1 polysaccharide biosynthesis tyrosine autokinase [Aquiflexum sp. TKW24L]
MKDSHLNMENNFKPGDQGLAFDPIKFFLKYIKYLPYIILSIIISLAIGYFVNKSTPPVYQANSKFYINQEVGNNGVLNLTGLSKVVVSGGIDQEMANQSVFLKSRSVASKALEKLDFEVDYFQPSFFIDNELYKSSPIVAQVDWEHAQLTGGKIKIAWTDTENFTLSLPDEIYKKNIKGSQSEELIFETPQIFKFKFGEDIELPFLKLRISLVKNLPEGEILINLNTKNTLVSKYSGDMVQIFPYDNLASVLGLTINTSHPQKGADYLDALMEVYLQLELEEKNRIAKNTVEFIDSQISGVSDSLSFFESNLETFRSGNKTYNIEMESSTVYQELTRLESELSQEKFNKDYFENLKNYLARENYDQIIAPSALGIQDGNLNSLINSLITLQQERSNILYTQTEASPRVREVNRKIQDTSGSLGEVLRSLSNNTQFRINELESRIARSENQFRRLPSTEQDLIKLQRGRELNETIITFLQQRRAEAAISMASSSSSNKIVEYAQANNNPITVKHTAIYLIFFGLGFIFPVVIIGIVLVLDNRIKDPKELEGMLAMPLLAKIPQNTTQIVLAVLKEPRSAIAESFRALKTNISFVVPLDRQLTIAVSSTLSGEGKTFTAINLASIYAVNKKKTILVSCDMFKPSTFKEFDLKGKVGLSNYLSKQVDSVFDIIQNTTYPDFDILTSGGIPPNPSDLLASERFISLLNQLKKIYDVIILDTPPVGLISQSFEVIKHVDLISFVLRYNYSEKSFIEEINAIKYKKGLQNIYAILNDVPSKELTYRGYNYGYYEESKRERKGLKGIFGSNKAAV